MGTSRSGTNRRVESDGEKSITKGKKSAEDLLLQADSETVPEVSIVLPTLNEEEGIGVCIEQIKNAIEEMQVYTEIIVSDSSSDLTPKIAMAKGAIVVKPDQPGYGYAYRYGFEHVRGEYVVMGDADTTYDFEELPKLLHEARTTNADVVLGSRFEGEIKPGAMPLLHQYVGNPLLTWFLNLFYETRVTDAHSGFRVLSRYALKRLELRSDGMEFASEMIMGASVKGMDIREVPITYHQRMGEATLDSFRDGWRHVKFMLVNAPGYVFSIPAVASILLGITLLVAAQLQRPFLDLYLGAHIAIVGSLLTIVGYEIGFLALLSRIAGQPIREPSENLSRWVQERVQLEHGATIGVLSFGVGSAMAAFLLARWITSGYTVEPLIIHEMPMFTAIVLGLQMIFNSLFLSLLAQS